MLRLYISYAPADKPYLDTLLKWLKPLQEKYFLHIWHNPVPLPGAKTLYQWDSMLDNLEQAHIYLFLTSPKSMSTGYIDQEELPRAVARQKEFGDKYVRIFPVLAAPSHWKKHPVLAGYNPLGGLKTLSEWKPDDAGYRELVGQLEGVVQELRRDWMEEYHRIGLPLDEFLRPERLSPGPATLKPIPGWAGLVLLFSIFYMVTSWYLSGCAPRMYHLYAPESLPYQPLPERYPRENPVQPPEEVPPRTE